MTKISIVKVPKFDQINFKKPTFITLEFLLFVGAEKIQP